ncbi:MAG: acetate--CoA ligase family protein [Nitrospirota bacterium]
MTLKEFIEKNRGRKVFLEHEVKELLKAAGFSVPKGIFIKKGGVFPESFDLNYPLIAKVSSSKISSKSDIGGIRAGIRDRHNLEDAVAHLQQIGDAEGVLVEEMAPQGIEVIVGGIIDQQFGPVVMLGLGGIFVELFKDVVFGLAPLDRENACWLIRQVKGYALLQGYRGSPPADIEALEEIIIHVSGMIASGMLEEITLNPVALYPEGAVILDAKMLTV